MQSVPRAKRTVPQRVGVFMFKWFFGLVMDEKAAGVWTVSLGRVLTVALMTQAMIGWSRGGDVLPGQQHVLIAMLAYTFGSKVVNQATEAVAGVRKPRRARTRASDAVPLSELTN